MSHLSDIWTCKLMVPVTKNILHKMKVFVSLELLWAFQSLLFHGIFAFCILSIKKGKKTYQAYCMYFKWISVLSVHSLKRIHVITIILSFSITLHSFLQKRATKHVVATVHTWYRSVCCQCLPYYHVVICMYFWLVTHLIRK